LAGGRKELESYRAENKRKKKGSFRKDSYAKTGVKLRKTVRKRRRIKNVLFWYCH
jgi:hypothetical protein